MYIIRVREAVVWLRCETNASRTAPSKSYESLTHSEASAFTCSP